MWSRSRQPKSISWRWSVTKIHLLFYYHPSTHQVHNLRVSCVVPVRVHRVRGSGWVRGGSQCLLGAPGHRLGFWIYRCNANAMLFAHLRWVLMELAWLRSKMRYKRAALLRLVIKKITVNGQGKNEITFWQEAEKNRILGSRESRWRWWIGWPSRTCLRFLAIEQKIRYISRVLSTV